MTERFIKLTMITGPRFTQAEMDAERRLWDKVIFAIDAGAGLKELYSILRAHRKTEKARLKKVEERK